MYFIKKTFLREMSHLKFKLFVGLILFSIIAGFVYLFTATSSFSCKKPEGFAKYLSKVYAKAVDDAIDILPSIKKTDARTMDLKNSDVAKFAKKLDKLHKKNAKKLQKCAVYYHKMNSEDQQKTRYFAYEAISKLYQTNLFYDFNQYLTSYPQLTEPMMDIRRVSRYVFIQPLKINQNSKEQNAEPIKENSQVKEKIVTKEETASVKKENTTIVKENV